MQIVVTIMSSYRIKNCNFRRIWPLSMVGLRRAHVLLLQSDSEEHPAVTAALIQPEKPRVMKSGFLESHLT